MLNLKSSNYKRSFPSISSFDEFINAEHEAWFWLLNNHSNTQVAEHAKRIIRDFFSQVRREIESIQSITSNNNLSTQETKDRISNFENTINNIFQNYINTGGFFSDDEKFLFISSLTEEDKNNFVLALHITGLFLGGKSLDAPVGIMAEAFSLKTLFDRGVKLRIPAERTKLNSLVSDARLLMDDIEILKSNTENLLIKKNEDIDNLIETFKAKFELETVARHNNFSNQLSTNTDSLNHLRATYEKFMELNSPVRYWEQKRVRHKKIIIALGTSILTAFLISGTLFYYLLTSLSEKYKEASIIASKKEIQQIILSSGKSFTSSQASAANKVLEAAGPVWHFDLAIFVLAATICFWILRILVRLLLSHVHLENDASERSTMARTYIALYRRRKLGSEDHEQLTTVLAALFRPSGDGLVKDDGAPPSFYELLTKLK